MKGLTREQIELAKPDSLWVRADEAEQQIKELKDLLIEVESIDAHAKVQNFNEDLQLRISDVLVNLHGLEG